MSLSKKIDFAVVFSVKNANPNGDPLNGNRPRTTLDSYGEMSDVCIKRKIRNRLMESGKKIFVQSDDNKNDTFPSLRARAEPVLANLPKKASREDKIHLVCSEWFDVRAFGQVFAYSADKKGEGLSIGVRGPVSVHPAFSVDPVEVTSIQITKSVSGEGDGEKKAADTMGMKHRVDKGIYVFYGSMNPQLADKTGFSDEDAIEIKNILPKLFENDESSARPGGSMGVVKVIWWEHSCKSGDVSSAKVHRSLSVGSDGSVACEQIGGLDPEIISGF
jgi:CRISPR-associated protein Csd2